MTGRIPPDPRPLEDVDGVGLGRRPSEEVDDEIAFHIAERIDQLVAGGLTRDAAQARAEAEFGPIADARADLVRSVSNRRARKRRAGLWSEWVGDTRYALRSARSRASAFWPAVLSIAVGMAAVSTIWTAVDRLVLRPLPYDLERRLVFVGSFQRGGGPSTPSAPADFLDLRAAARTVDLAAYRGGKAISAELPRRGCRAASSHLDSSRYSESSRCWDAPSPRPTSMTGALVPPSWTTVCGPVGTPPTPIWWDRRSVSTAAP